MEKRSPHYPLLLVKKCIRQGAYRVTRTALSHAALDFGYFSESRIAAEVLALRHRDFYKAMTTHHDAMLWQDVYRPTIKGIRAYVKIQIVDNNTIVISFKKR